MAIPKEVAQFLKEEKEKKEFYKKLGMDDESIQIICLHDRREFYKNYEFKYKFRSIDNEELINIFYNIGIEFIKKTAPDNVIMLLVRLAQKEKAKREKRRIYTPPVYVENGKTGDLKSKLK